jgi:hypothetical protein
MFAGHSGTVVDYMYRESDSPVGEIQTIIGDGGDMAVVLNGF